MKKKGFSVLLALLIFTICSVNMSVGQTNDSIHKKHNLPFSEKSTGFYNVTTVYPLSFTGQFLCGVQTICGYEANPHLAIGVGIGYEQFNSILTYDNFKANLTLLPVFIDIRYTFLSTPFSPVIAVDGGYKFLLNKATTQTRIDTTYGNIDEIPSRFDNKDYNIFTQGGLFVTAEVGVKARLFHKIALFLAIDYSLWAISGTYYLSNQTDIQGSDGWVTSTPVETTEKSVAYVNAFLVKLGIVF